MEFGAGFAVAAKAEASRRGLAPRKEYEMGFWLNGGEKSQYTIRLDELPVRPSRTTRIRASFSMRGVDRLFVEIADLGFGEIFPSSGIRWEKELRV